MRWFTYKTQDVTPNRWPNFFFFPFAICTSKSRASKFLDTSLKIATGIIMKMASKEAVSAVPTNERAVDQEQFSAVGATTNPVKDASVLHEENGPKALEASDLPSPDEIIERLGIENWKRSSSDAWI